MLYITEPQNNSIGLWIFGTLILLCFAAFVIMLVVGGTKKKEPRLSCREPRYWDTLTISYKEGDLDEHEAAISGEIDGPPLMKVQRN